MTPLEKNRGLARSVDKLTREVQVLRKSVDELGAAIHPLVRQIPCDVWEVLRDPGSPRRSVRASNDNLGREADAVAPADAAEEWDAAPATLPLEGATLTAAEEIFGTSFARQLSGKKRFGAAHRLLPDLYPPDDDRPQPKPVW